MTGVNVKRFASESGSELIECALVLPLLLLVVLGIFDFGFLFQRYEVVTNAAREGARIGILPAYSTADVQARVAAYAAASGLPPGSSTTVETVTVTTPSGSSFPAVRVTVEYPHQFLWLAPFASRFGGSFGTVTLRAVSVMRSEGATQS